MALHTGSHRIAIDEAVRWRYGRQALAARDHSSDVAGSYEERSPSWTTSNRTCWNAGSELDESTIVVAACDT